MSLLANGTFPRPTTSLQSSLRGAIRAQTHMSTLDVSIKWCWFEFITKRTLVMNRKWRWQFIFLKIYHESFTSPVYKKKLQLRFRSAFSFACVILCLGKFFDLLVRQKLSVLLRLSNSMTNVQKYEEINKP